MAVPRSTLWPIQPHTKVKHLILRRYLDAWLPIMATWNGRIVFIDGFAGPGRYSGGEPGSPVIALRALLEHSHFRDRSRGAEVVFVFIEGKADRCESLKASLDELMAELPLPSWVKVEIRLGEFATNLSSILDSVEKEGSQIAPTFAFVDPFGFSGLPLDLVARLLRNPKCECLINFSFDSVNRFLEHPDPEIQKNFDELFGTVDWKNALSTQDAQSRQDAIVQLYCRQLSVVAKVKFVRTFEMVNDGNRTEYVLVYGTNSREGLSKMKEAMWRADPEGGHVFSDRSDPNQMVLLGVGGEAGLADALAREYRGKGAVTIEEVERFVLEETPYAEKKHLRMKTLKPMETASPARIQVLRPAGARRTVGQYPPGTMLEFI